MAYSKQAVVSTGALTYMPISIAYMFRDEIKVYFNDVLAVDGTWSWVGSTDRAISFSPAIAAGVTVRVQRFTRLGAMTHDFTDGAQFLAANLDDNYTQLQHSLQEVAESGLTGLPAEGGVSGVSSLNGRTGALLLNSADVIGALGYAPANGSLLVKSFNGRTGDVVLTAADLVAAGGGGGGGGGTVLNVAALRAAASVGGTAISTRGYYAAGDGGAATYYLDATDTSSSDNSGSVIVATDGGRWKLAKGPIYSAKQFGARGDSSYAIAGSDDTVPLQRFLDYIQKVGSKGYIPSGRYRCTNQLNIGESCFLYGDGWKDVRDMTTEISPNSRDWTKSKVIGTILYADFFTGVAPAQIYVTGNNVTIADMEFETNQPAPSASSWAPNPVPLAISAFRNNYYEQGGNSLTVDNVMLRNHNNGIKLFGVARGYLNNLYGQCFGVAVDVSHNGDVFRANNLHFNWSFFSGRLATNNYMDANCTTLLLGRVDNPIVSNFFTFGGLVGIRFYVDQIVPDGGSTFRLQGSNIGLDNMGTGVLMTDACSASFTNLYVFNRNNLPESRGIHTRQVLGGGYVPCRLNLVNCDFEGSMAEAIRLETPGSCNMANVQITNYNNSGSSFPAISVFSDITLQYANLSNTTASTTPLTQAYGTGQILGGAGGGGGAGVLSFNTRSGAVVLTSADVSQAYVTTGRLLDNGGTFRSTQTTSPGTGAGVELNYDSVNNVGFLNAYNRTSNLYQDLGVGGRNITFRNQAGNVGSWDASGNLIILTAPLTSDNSNKVPTTAWVRSYVASGVAGVASFNTRTGAVTLTASDVTGSLGYTPPNSSNPSTSGLLGHSGTARMTSSSTPGSGVGLELSYNAAGFVNAFNRSSNAYVNLGLGGDAIIFTNNTGVVGQFTASGEFLIGTTTDSGAYRLQVNGQIWATSATIATSDGRLKQNIASLGEATSVVKALRAVTYDFKDHPTLDLPKGTQVGVIAQEVQAAIGHLPYSGSVVSAAGEYLGVAEVKLVPLLLKALQEAFTRIEALERK